MYIAGVVLAMKHVEREQLLDADSRHSSYIQIAIVALRYTEGEALPFVHTALHSWGGYVHTRLVSLSKPTKLGIVPVVINRR